MPSLAPAAQGSSITPPLPTPPIVQTSCIPLYESIIISCYQINKNYYRNQILCSEFELNIYQELLIFLLLKIFHYLFHNKFYLLGGKLQYCYQLFVTNAFKEWMSCDMFHHPVVQVLHISYCID